MRAENLTVLERVIKQKSAELGFCQKKLTSGVIPIAAPRERVHLMTELNSPVVPALPLQMSIRDSGNAIRALLFPSPPIIHNEQAAEQFLILENEANRELYRGAALGRFWVDIKNLDFAYELILKESIFESNAEEIAAQLFDVPLAHFRDLHIPLVMLAGGA